LLSEHVNPFLPTFFCHMAVAWKVGLLFDENNSSEKEKEQIKGL
jgi:hypothetical protein